jgi:hypothetical protein
MDDLIPHRHHPAPRAADRLVSTGDFRDEGERAALRKLIAQVYQDVNDEELVDLAARLSVELATAIEWIAREHGLSPLDLAEIWFVD